MMWTFYTSGGRIFHTYNEAIKYSNFIARLSGLIIAVERV